MNWWRLVPLPDALLSKKFSGGGKLGAEEFVEDNQEFDPEKQQLTCRNAIVSDPEPDKLPTIFITSCIEASDRLLSTTTEPLIKYLISIGDPGDDPPQGYTQVPHRLRLEFHDLITPLDEDEDEEVLATPEDILNVINFASLVSQGNGDVLIHCPAGISRSSAVALTVYAVLLGPGREEEALAYVLAARPQAIPNRWIVELADEALGREGKLIKVAQNYLDSLFEFDTP